MRARLLTVGLAGIALPAVLAACGGDDRLSAKDYRAKLATLAKQQNKPQADVEKAFHSKTVDGVRTGVLRFSDHEQGLADELATLKPPKDAEAANTKLAHGARVVAAELRAAVADLKGVKSPKAAGEQLMGSPGIAKGSKEFDAALDELRKKGYSSGGG